MFQEITVHWRCDGHGEPCEVEETGIKRCKQEITKVGGLQVSSEFLGRLQREVKTEPGSWFLVIGY